MEVIDTMNQHDERRAETRARGRRGSAGFTLVEMLIVMTLVGTVVGFSIEGLRSYRETQRARAGAIQVITVLNMAKSRAVSMNQVTVVDFDPGGLTPGNGFYEVFLDMDDDAVRDPGEVAAANLSDVTRRAGMLGYQLPSAMYFDRPASASTGPLGIPVAADGVTFTNNAIVFFPDGTAAESGHVTLMDPAARTYAITLTAGGAVRMYRWDGSTWK